MPEFNIAPRTRFRLYVFAALLVIVVKYTVAKEWAGQQEFNLAADVSALLNLLAAAKVDMNEQPGGPALTVQQATDVTVTAEPAAEVEDAPVGEDPADFEPPADVEFEGRGR